MRRSSPRWCRHGGASNAEYGAGYDVSSASVTAVFSSAVPGAVGLTEPAGQELDRERLGDEEALTELATEPPQERDVPRTLDTLGDHPQAEIVGEIDGRAHDHQVLLVGVHLGDEGPVDLQLVERQPLLMRERGVAGAEVVDRQAQAQIVEAEQVALGAGGIEHDRALGEFQRDPGRIDLPLLEQVGDGARQLVVVQAAR